MATYTDIGKLRTDVFKVGDDNMDERVLNRASVMAYNIINARLDGIYAVPFTTTPALITDISDLLTKALSLTLALRRGGTLFAPDEKGSEADIAMKMLDDIASGKLSLVGVTRLATRDGEHTLDGYIRLFDLDDIYDQLPDQNYIDDVEAERT